MKVLKSKIYLFVAMVGFYGSLSGGKISSDRLKDNLYNVARHVVEKLTPNVQKSLDDVAILIELVNAKKSGSLDSVNIAGKNDDEVDALLERLEGDDDIPADDVV